MLQWDMWRPPQLTADMFALQSNVERAGWTLACPFTSSAEFEAAVIRSRRKAGAYGRGRGRRSIAYAGAAIGTLIALFLLI
jgi:hypothetical protein